MNLLSFNVGLFILSKILFVYSTKYYVTRNEIKKKLDEPKKPLKDSMMSSNSNDYMIEEDSEAHDVADYGSFGESEHYPRPYLYYEAAEKKHSKLLGDELGLLLIVAAIAICLGFLSSLIVPLTLLFLNGGLTAFGGLGTGINGINGVTAAGFPGGFGRRRRRSAYDNEDKYQNIRMVVNQYLDQLDSALKKFSHNKLYGY